MGRLNRRLLGRGLLLFASAALLVLLCALAMQACYVWVWGVLPLLALPLAQPLVQLIPYSLGRLSIWVVVGLSMLFVLSYVGHLVDDYFAPIGVASPHALHAMTGNGREYTHDTLSLDRENGRPVWCNVCDAELMAEWKRVAGEEVDPLLWQILPVRMRLIHYLTSLGLRKDSVGVSLLRMEDVEAIRAGEYNYRLRGRGAIYRYFWSELERVERYLQGDSAELKPFGGLLLGSMDAWRRSAWLGSCEVVAERGEEGMRPVALLALVAWIGLGASIALVVLLWGCCLVAYRLMRLSLCYLIPYWVCVVILFSPLDGLWIGTGFLLVVLIGLRGLELLYPQKAMYLCPWNKGGVRP